MLDINQHFADDMRSRVYIETSVISYLTARKGKDAMKAACQQVTLRWWNTRLAAVDPFISPYVVEEASAGDRGLQQRELTCYALSPCSASSLK